MDSLPSTHACSTPRWYALFLRSRYEKRTHQELVGKGIESFLPLIEEVHVWSDRKKKTVEPLFRGYLFVRTDLHDRVNILQTEGVVHFVSTKGKPSAIPDRQIEWVQRIVACPGSFRRESFVSLGECVRIVGGPFAGIEGIVTRHKGVARIILALEAIMQAVSVEVDDTMVEKVPRLQVRAVSKERPAKPVMQPHGYPQ